MKIVPCTFYINGRKGSIPIHIRVPVYGLYDPIKKPIYITTCGGGLMMKKLKGRKEYRCDKCKEKIGVDEEYYHLDMTPGQYHQFLEDYSSERDEFSIIKRSCVGCVEKNFIKIDRQLPRPEEMGESIEEAMVA